MTPLLWVLSYVGAGAAAMLAFAVFHDPDKHESISSAEWVMGVVVWPILIVAAIVVAVRVALEYIER